jgi:hypothetical protein
MQQNILQVHSAQNSEHKPDNFDDIFVTKMPVGLLSMF